MNDLLAHTRDDRGVHRLTLNDAARFNVLGDAMLAALSEAVTRIAADEGARALVIAARGKAFCAGHDLREMAAQDKAQHLDLFERCSRFMVSLARLPVPVIAAVQGVAAAAGCQLVAQCDLAIAANGTRFGVNGIDIGLFCGTPSVALLRNVPHKAGMHMLMTGDFVDAEAALRLGLVSEVCAPEGLDAAVEALLLKLLARPREALAMGKALVAQQRTLGLEAAYALASRTMAENLALPVTQEGVRAFVDKRAPNWRVSPADPV
ncbi:enoyl-CoA hydratase [Comamonas serinivorans]|uniref:Enoyl-CoA hydratase domain-containing protein 3, mitochondrial n=1 Tax=Comamonas serinivorans TaxID=1082851 RepID=A0A1Y0ET33_9BURK|nr:enoyl-CoA hydratase [Comamonas serinivorans]ARU06753.1 enoyl-CoA hydratase [Comamonas serinivorans]